MIFGSFLLALTTDGRHLLVWDTNSEGPFATSWLADRQLTTRSSLELECNITFDNDFTATHILHPATYLNKILVASAEGGLQLWNIRAQYVRIILESERYHSHTYIYSSEHAFTTSTRRNSETPAQRTPLAQSPPSLNLQRSMLLASASRQEKFAYMISVLTNDFSEFIWRAGLSVH